MQINPNVFREYDIRGIAGQDLTEENMEHLGKAYIAYLRQNSDMANNTVVIGRDGRLSSKPFSQALIRGITAAGVNVIDIGEVPTPVTYYALNELDVDGGLMLTASHNPGNYNGVKIAVGHMTIYGEEIQKLRGIAEQGGFPEPDAPGKVTEKDMTLPYQARILQDVKLARKLKVVVDAGNGVGGVVAVPLFEKLGCEVTPLFCKVDGNFPNHHPDPTKAENLVDLMAEVKKQGADVGIGFDGDVDRIGGCDSEGNMLSGDRLLALFARQILAEKPGSVIIGEVKCSRSMYEDIEAHGGKAVMWRTGHSHIKAAMLEKGAELAGEMSGHIFFKHRWYGFDDAIYSAARLLEIVAGSDEPLSAMLESIPQRPTTPEIEFECSDDKKFEVVAEATRYFKEDMGFEVITIDGARIEFPDGWGLVRASNTSPKLVMRVEADTQERVEEIQKIIQDKVQELAC